MDNYELSTYMYIPLVKILYEKKVQVTIYFKSYLFILHAPKSMQIIHRE